MPNTPTLAIRRATPADLDIVAKLETDCFLPSEAASREAMAERMARFADGYWLLFEGDRLVSLAGGMASNTSDLSDMMYADATLHVPDGKYRMIFSVATYPDRRRLGYAGMALRALIDAAREEGRTAVVLTCKPRLVHYYASFGFVDEGISPSEHGGVVWHQMRLVF